MDRLHKILIGACALTTVCSFILGIGVFTLLNQNTLSIFKALTWNSLQEETDITLSILNEIDPKTLEENLQWISQSPHEAGSNRDENIAMWIRQLFRKYQFDDVQVSTYKALLSYPSAVEQSRVELLDGSGEIQFSTNPGGGFESGRAMSNMGGPSAHFHAYSPSGAIESTLIYANYGRDVDFLKLQELSIPIVDRLVIVREGQISSAEKAFNAEAYGAVGLIVYPDPETAAKDGESPLMVYPNNWWLPSDARRSDSVLTNPGDPLTPGWPAKPNVHRLKQELVESWPNIPSLPISYNAAREILSVLGGRDVPYGWHGRLQGVQYKLGGEFKLSSNVKRVLLTVKNQLTPIDVSNVIGIIQGSVEPDRYVILGGRRDSWGNGAVNPSTGTAAMMALAQSITKVMKDEGWRPRRSLVFASWGGGQHGEIGSTEWVEEHFPKLKDRTVAYINAEGCSFGPSLDTTATKDLEEVILEALKLIPNPQVEQNYMGDEVNSNTKGEGSYYDYWMNSPGDGFPTNNLGFSGPRAIQRTMGRGDFTSFQSLMGSPVMDIQLVPEKHNLSSFPLASTEYDTFAIYKSAVDPKLQNIQTCAKIMGYSVRALSDRPILPNDATSYFDIMKEGLLELQTLGMFDNSLEQLQNISLGPLETAITNFGPQAKNFSERVKEVDENNPLAVRMINDQIMGLARIFVLKSDFPGITGYNALVGSVKDQPRSVIFPKLRFLVSKLAEQNLEEKNRRHEKLRLHVTELFIMIEQATSYLKAYHII